MDSFLGSKYERAEADLSDYDFSPFKPAHFEFEKKSAQINRRVPEAFAESRETDGAVARDSLYALDQGDVGKGD